MRFLRRLRLALPLAARQHRISKAKLKAFTPDKPIGRSTGRLLEHLAKIAKLVQAHDEKLRPYFRGETPSEVLAAVSAEFRDATGNRLFSRTTVPIETRKLNLAKGRLLEQVEDLNRIAQIAFIDEPAIAAQYDMRVLAQARRGRRRKAAASAKTKIDEGGALPANEGRGGGDDVA